MVQPAPAPRFSATPASRPTAPEASGASTFSALAEWGIPAERIEALAAARAIGTAD